MAPSDPGGRFGIAVLKPAPPRPIVVSPARLTPGPLLLAVGVPVGAALILAHFGELHPHLAWFLGVMGLLMLLGIAGSRRLAFARGEVHCHTRLFGVLVRDRPLISEAALESIVVRGIPSVGLEGTSQYQLLLVGGGEQRAIGPFGSRQRASEARLAILAGLAASHG